MQGNENRFTAVPPNWLAAIFNMIFTANPKVTPITIPLTPPRKPTTIDSETKSALISLGDAPIVLMIPISFVRSRRVTVIVLNIPIADTRSAIPPNVAKYNLNTLENLRCLFYRL
jgi:hypothetical protein